MQHSLEEYYEIWRGEGLKSMTESSLHYLGSTAVGSELLTRYATGGHPRIEDDRLRTNIAGIVLENPVIVGAGWDKKGRAIHGLYALNFAATEIGTVPPRGQEGKDKPRLWTLTDKHDIGINNFGFNSPGSMKVQRNLRQGLPYPGKIALSVGRNATTPNERANDDHAIVIRRLGHLVDFIVLGISSPNTEDIRSLQRKNYLAGLIVGAKEAMPIPVPLFIKIDPERSEHELHDMLEVGLACGLDGIIATNTYSKNDLKAKYGARWANQPGGLSGNDPDYRRLATQAVRFLYEEAGDLLTIIGVGGVHDADTALDKIRAGASAVQIVTAIRPSWGRVAAHTNKGILAQIKRDGVVSVRDYIGVDTKRGALLSSDNW